MSLPFSSQFTNGVYRCMEHKQVANIAVEDKIISGGVIKEFNLSFFRMAHRLSVKLCGQLPWQEVENFYTINLLAGLRSAIVDNVPLIAAIMRSTI